MSLRALILHPSDEGYGADRILFSVIGGLRQAGFQIEVLFPDDSEGKGWLSGQLDAIGIPYVYGPLAPARRRFLQPTALPGYARALLTARSFVRRRAKDLRADVLYVNTTAFLVGAIVGRPNGARVLWHVHEIIQKPRVLSYIFRSAPITADLAIVVSDAVLRNLSPAVLARRRAVRVYNGLPERPLPNTERSADIPLVSWIGRLSRWKGYEIFIDAAAIAAAQEPNVRFAVAGGPVPGEEWRVEDLKARIAWSDLEDRLEYLGLLAEPDSLFDRSTVVCASAIWPDPLPTVVLEAMRSGCVVIASNHGGAPEMVVDGVTGLLVPPGNAVLLAAAILRVVRDSSAAEEMGRAAAQRFNETFTATRFVKEMTDLIVNTASKDDR